MKYYVTLRTTAEMVATVEVEAEDKEEAREKALEDPAEVEFELDFVNYEFVSAEDVATVEE